MNNIKKTYKKWNFFLLQLAYIVIILTLVLLIVYLEYKVPYIVLLTLVLYSIVIIVSIYIANSSKRNLTTKLSWLISFIVFPVISIIIFFIWGSNPFKRKNKNNFLSENYKMQTSKQIEFTKWLISNIKNDQNNFNFINSLRYANSYLDSVACNNSSFSLIEDNTTLYEKTIELIRSAKKQIFLQFFIINQGVWFETILQELIKAANKGVKIYIIYDWWGSWKLNRFLIKKINNIPNIYFNKFKAKSDIPLRWTTNFRNHCKSIIIDNEIVLYGGSNLADEYLNIKKNTQNWKDWNFLIKGEIVLQIISNFINFWNNYTDVSDDNKINIDEISLEQKTIIKNKKQYCYMLNSYPNYSTRILEDTLLMLLNNAQSSITILTPYLIPTIGIKNALISAAKKGVIVKLIVPKCHDNKRMLLLLNNTEYEEFLNNNIQIYEYPAFIHSKMFLIDDNISIIGTMNLDIRSIMINFESIIVINDKNMNDNLQKYITSYFQKSIQFNLTKKTISYLKKIKIYAYLSTFFRGLL